MKFLKITFSLLLLGSSSLLAMDTMDEKENSLFAFSKKNSNNHKRQNGVTKSGNQKSEKKVVQKRTMEKSLLESKETQQPSKLQKTENKAKIASSTEFKPSLSQDLKNISQQIEKSREEANWVKIYKTFEAFQALSQEESEWQSLGQELKAYKWPSQHSWKEVVGGHLFFPQKTIEWEVVDFESFRLRRIDMLWSFAVGAKFNHSLSKFYLVRMLDKIRSDYTDAETPEFFKKLYSEAFTGLSQCENNPDACYVIGHNFFQYPYLSKRYVEDIHDDLDEKAIEWHKKGKDLRNQYEILEIKKACSAVYPSPTLEEYLSLARQGYTPAYGDVLGFMTNPEEREKMREEAISKGYKYALFGLAFLHQDNGDIEKAREIYLRAGQTGVSHAFVKLGTTYDGEIYDHFKMERIDLKKHPNTDIKSAIKAYTLAGEALNPEGWEHLATLYRELFDQKVISEKVYQDKIIDVLQEGTRLGSAWCYDKSYFWLPQKAFDFFIKNFGYPPQHELRYNIEAFLNKKH